jgi:hypothetical protein
MFSVISQPAQRFNPTISGGGEGSDFFGRFWQIDDGWEF